MSPSANRIAVAIALAGLLLLPLPSASFRDDSETPRRVMLAEPADRAEIGSAEDLFRWEPLPGAESYVLLLSAEPFDAAPGADEPEAPMRLAIRRNAVAAGRLDLSAGAGGEWHWAVAARRGGRWETSEVWRFRVRRAVAADAEPIRRAGRRWRAPADREGEVRLAGGIRVEPASAHESGEGYRYGIVRFRGPVRAEWRAAVEARGAVVVGYLPDDALVVRLEGARPEEIAASPAVRWVSPYRPEFKRSPELASSAKGGDTDAVVLLFPGEDAARIADEFRADGVSVEDVGRDVIAVRAPAPALEAIADDERVRWVERRREIRAFNDQCQWVVQTDVSGQRTLWSRGLRGSGVLLSLCDSGLRTGHDMFRDGAVPISTYGDYPAHRKVIAYRRSVDSPFVLFGDDEAASYHGTHTACTLAGNDTTFGQSHVDGIAPDAKLFFIDGGGASNVIYTPIDVGDLFLAAYEGNEAGAPRIMSNSWGVLGGGAYDFLCEETDRFAWEHQDFLLVFSNGNGAIANSVASPAAAKNCVGAGGTENGASANQIYAPSSRGPADDGRRKPTIAAPARLVSASGAGDAAYQTLDGTSMSAPSLAAGAGLVLEYFREGYYPTGVKGASPGRDPSAALLRATLVAGGESDVAGYEIPSNDIGWGRLRLESVLSFEGETRRLAVVDETAGLRTGESAFYEVTVASSAEPLEVALVWTDYPSSPAASRNLVNDLDLVLRREGETYLGNVFAGGASAAGGVRDSVNVEEVALVAAPATGAWTIEVRAASVPFGPQPFAIVVTGALDAAAGSIALDRSTYGGADTITVRVEDGDLAAPPAVAIRCDTESEPESLLLAGSGGVYTGRIATGTSDPVAGDGVLSVSAGDSVRVVYADGAATRAAAAGVSLAGPVILPAWGEAPGDAPTTVAWETDVPADSRVLFGLDPSSLGDTIEAPELVLSHRVDLPDLLPDTTYYYAVSSADFAGNRTVDGGGAEPYRLTTGPRADVLVVIGDHTFERADTYRDALDRFGWSGRIHEGTIPSVGDRTSGLRAHPVVWWQAGWEEYPPFSGAARETIDRYLGGGGRLAVVSHDVAWAFGDPSSGFWSAEAEAWLADRLKVEWVADPSYWNIVFGYTNDWISGDYTFGISYAPFRSNGGAGDEIAAAASAVIDSVWKNNYAHPVGVRWSEAAASGDPDSAVWGGRANKGVTYCFEWSELNDWIDDDYHRARVFDRTVRWLVGRDHPDVTLTWPVAGAAITVVPTTISWNETAYGGVGVAARRLEWSGDGGASWNRIDDDAPASPYTWDLAGVPNGTAVRVRVTLFDGGDPSLTGKDETDGDLAVAIPGNDPRGPRVIAGSASTDPDPIAREGLAVLTAVVSDSTRGGSNVAAAEWSTGPAAPGEGTPMSGPFGALTVTAVDTIDGAIFAAPRDTIWIRGRDAGGAWGEAYPLAVTVRGNFTGLPAEAPPALFALRGNAPNPFNPATMIRFTLAAPSRARLTIYSPAGRLVRELEGGNLAAGPHEIVWDGRDDGGRDAPSGVYLVRLEAGRDRAVRKMVLLK